jgi:hypothetical protein
MNGILTVLKPVIPTSRAGNYLCAVMYFDSMAANMPAWQEDSVAGRGMKMPRPIRPRRRRRRRR